MSTTTSASEFQPKLRQLDELIAAWEKTVFGPGERAAKIRIFQELHKTINQLDFGEFRGVLQASSRFSQSFSTRIICIVMELLCLLDKKRIETWVVEVILVDRRLFVATAEASGFRGTRAIRENLAWRMASSADETRLTDARGVLANLAFSSLDSISDEVFGWILKSAKELALQSVLSLLADKEVFSEKGEHRRTLLLEKDHDFSSLRYSTPNLSLVSRAWMYCTYAETENRHKIKESLNAWCRGYARSLALVRPGRPKATRTRPRVLVIGEILTSSHVMWRWYGGQIRSLAHEFELELASQPADVDEEVKASFSKWHCVSGLESLGGIISESTPDIVYYPSIGMRPWSILLSNIQVAPVQIMSLGHPASSRSDSMNYVLMQERRARDSQKEFSEKIVPFQTDTLMFSVAHPKSTKFELEVPDLKENIVRIAIVGKSFKISHQLLSALARIRSKAGKKIVYDFFPNETGLIHEQIKIRLNDGFKDCNVYPSVAYDKYQKRLSECDFAISTFPFGQTSGIIDCLSVGLPVIELRGSALHTRLGSILLDSLGLNEKFIMNTVDELVSRSIDLIENPSELSWMRQKVKAINLPKKGQATGSTELADIFKKMYLKSA
jgi:hypothetical protein